MNRSLTLLVLLSLPAAAAAADGAQPPLTGRMLGQPAPGPQAPPAPGPVSAPAWPSDAAAAPAAWRRAEVGDATRALLRLQADGLQAAPSRPILGVQADASYRRYLRSFEYDIPEYFRTTVDTGDAAGTE